MITNLISCSGHDTHVKNISSVEISGAETLPFCQENTWMIRWNLSVSLMLDLMALTSSQPLPTVWYFLYIFVLAPQGNLGDFFQSNSTSAWKPSRNWAKEKWKRWRITAIFSFYCPGAPLSADISPAVYWRDTENVTFSICLIQYLYSQIFQWPFSTFTQNKNLQVWYAILF